MSNEETSDKGNIDISKKSIDEMLNESQRKKSPSNDIHYVALTKIRDIIRESEIIDNHPDFLKGKDGKRSPLNGVNNDVNIDILYGAISYEGITYRVKTTIKRYINRESKAYAYSVEKIEVLTGKLSNAESTTPNAKIPIIGNSLLQGVYKVNKETGENGELALNDYSKVLDENGEPLVVYHGTDQEFTVLDAFKSRANMDIQGNFFSPWELDAQGYGLYHLPFLEGPWMLIFLMHILH